MANVHRVYDIHNDAYYVRVEGSPDIYRFTGLSSQYESYQKLRSLVAAEQQRDKNSRMIDHAQPT